MRVTLEFMGRRLPTLLGRAPGRGRRRVALAGLLALLVASSTAIVAGSKGPSDPQVPTIDVAPGFAPAVAPNAFHLGNHSQGTLELGSNLLVPGNPNVVACRSPAAGAISARSNELFTICEGAVVAINLTTGASIATLAVGSRPTGIDLDPSLGRAFVANSGSGTVSVLDVGRATVNDTIPVGGIPAGVVVDSAAGEVFVGNQASGEVSVINATSDEVTGTVATGNASALGLDPWNGDLYVVDANDSRVIVVDPTNGSILARVPVGGDPAGLAFDPDRGTAFVVNLNDGNVSAIDAANWTSASISVYDPASLTDQLAFDPLNGVLYVVASSGDLEAISSANATNFARLAVGSSPDGIVFDPFNAQLYVADAGSANLTLVNATVGVSDGSVWVGADPAEMVVDADSGGVVVAEPARDAIVIVPSGAGARTATVLVSHEPSAMLYDNATRDLYVTFSDNGAVGDVDGATDRLLATVPVGVDPTGEVLDALTGTIWITNAGSDNVSVLDPESDRVVATFAAGSAEDAVAWDPVSDRIFVANFGSANLTVFNATTLRPAGNVGVGSQPIALAVDAATGTVFSLSAYDRNVTEVSGTTDHVVGNLALGGAYPVAMAFDPSQGRLDVAAIAPDEVRVIDAASGSAVANVSLNGTTNGIGLDPSNDELYVPYLGAGFAAYVAVIDGATDRVVQTVATSGTPGPVLADPTAGLVVVVNGGGWALVLGNGSGHPQLAAVPVGTDPTGLTADSISGAVYLGDPLESAISILWPEPVYGLGFEEAGLPNGTGWTVDVAGISISSTSPEVVVPSPNGTYDWSADSTGDWFPSPSGGSVTVLGANRTVLITFGPVFPVTFHETGLPAGAWWSVAVGAASNASDQSDIGFLLGDGSYEYNVSGPVGWTAAPATGGFTVSGAYVQRSIAFAPLPTAFPVVLNAVGLPTGTEWTARVNGTTNSTGGTSMTWYLDNGSYPFEVSGVPGFRLSAFGGEIVVSGQPVDRALNWTVTTFPVTFPWHVQPVPPSAPSGGGGNDSWAVTLDGGAHSAPVGQSLVLDLPNGSYVYAAEPPVGYATYGRDSGEFNVTGTNLTVPIGFAVIPPGAPAGPALLGIPAGLFVGLIAAITVGGVLFAAYRRRQRRIRGDGS